MFSKQLIAVTLCVLLALAAPSPLIPIRRSQNPVPGRYIVTFKNGVDRAIGVSSLTNQISHHSTVTHEWDIINGFAGNFINADVEFLRTHPNVASIEEDGHVQTQAIVTQTNATWGLGRISSNTKLGNQDVSALTFSYDYDETAGANSNVFLIDSGILITHPAFGGRAYWGMTFGGYGDTDGYGHGTHCAGIAVSGPYGVAKSANVFSVKIFNDTGIGYLTDLISALDWVRQASRNLGRPAVAALSFYSSYSESINNAVATLVASGVTTVVAAGNSATDASNLSPASEPSAITVGASTIDDAKADYSNYGPVLDIWAPGTDIISTWKDGGAKSNSGTSMAVSYVTGYVANLLTLDSSLTPADISSTIKSKALTGVLTGIPDGTTNALLNNGFY